MPPSGPTTKTMRSGSGEDSSAVSAASASESLRSAVSWRTKTASASAKDLAREAPRTRSRSTGNRERRACREAAPRRFSHFAAIFSRFFAGQSAIERSAAQGMTSSTPISVAVSMACRSRSPLARAWTSTRRGPVCSSFVTAVTSIVSSVAEAAVTVPRTRVPSPSTISISSPGPIRRTRTACPATSSPRVRADPTTASAAVAERKTGRLTDRRTSHACGRTFRGSRSRSGRAVSLPHAVRRASRAVHAVRRRVCPG